MDSPVQSRRLIITIHGIRTFGNWQERLEALVRERDPDVRVQHYKYGYFSCLAFMLPFLRWWVTRRFRRALVAACAGPDPGRIDVVAHSFGTHLVAWGLHGIPRGERPRIHTLILAGSVLKPTFPWQDLTDDCVERVVNDCGTRDGVLVLNQALVLFTGMAGRVGFAGMSNDRFRNRYFPHGHSGYFVRDGCASDDFMRTWWLPVLQGDGPLSVPPDPRDATPIQGLVAFALNNAEPVKVAVYAAPFVFLTILFFGLYRQADRERAQARQRLVALQVANAERRSDEGDLAAALVWYAEALRSGDAQTERDQRMRFATALRQLPALTQVLFLEEWPPNHAELDPQGTLLAIAGGYFGEEGARVWDVATGNPITPLLAHSNTVNSIAFSPDGERLATGSSDQTARVWNARTGAPVTPPLRHDARLTLVRFSPDGGRVLTVGEGSSAEGVHRASVWDVRTAARLGTALSHASTIGDASFSPDGERVVTIAYDGKARIWDAVSGEPASPDMAAGESVYVTGSRQRAVFDADGRRLATSCNGRVIVWDARTGARLAGAWDLSDPRCLEFVDEDGVLGVGGRGEAQLWSIALDAPSGPPVVHGGSPATSISVSGAVDGHARRIAVGSSDSTARVWDSSTENALTPPLRQTGVVRRTCISRLGTRVATVDVAGVVRLWDLSARPAIVLRGEEPLDFPGVGSAQFSADGARILSTSTESQAAHLWDASTGAHLLELAHGHAVECACLSPDGRRAVTAGKEGTARVWDTRTGGPVGAAMEHGERVTCVGFSPDGTRLVTGCEDGTARVWDASDGSALGASIEYGPPIVTACFTPDGRAVLVAGGASAKLHDAQTGERLTQGPRQNEIGLSAAALSPDGQRIASGGLDGVARVWDARTGEAVTPPCVHSGGPQYANLSQRVNHVEFSPDSSLFATSSADGTTRIWNAVTGAPAAPPLPGADAWAAFSPDGRWIATAGADGVARVWSASTGAALSPPLVHEAMVTSVAFDARGERLVSACLDGTTRIWDLATDDRPAEELRRLAEVLASGRIDETGGLVELTSEELRERWAASRAGSPR